jgi:dTDP-glucose 4,6-dehydratase
MNVLVTGGAGFIGSNFVRHILQTYPDVAVTNFDKLTYAGNAENLADVVENDRYQFIRGDIADREAVDAVFGARFDAVVHFAAETHVDRSIEDAAPFLRANVAGTHCLLEAVRRFGSARFIHISTDEVYGSTPAGIAFKEEAALRPASPYAASKAAAEHLVTAYAKTHGTCAVILRCSNNYGPNQFPEKLIPLVVSNAHREVRVPVYGDGLQEREWLFVEDCCGAIAAALWKAKGDTVYNVSSGAPRDNLSTVQLILREMGKPESLIEFVKDRPGHDRRYAMDSRRIREELGWVPGVGFEEGIRRTIAWYKENAVWLEHARSGEYLEYYERQYGRRKS